METIEKIRGLCNKIEQEYAKDGAANDDIIVASLAMIEKLSHDEQEKWI